MGLALNGCALFNRGEGNTAVAGSSGRTAIVLPDEHQTVPAVGENLLSAQAIADYDDVSWARWPSQNLPEGLGQAAIWIAHPKLPLPAYVELTRIDTGRTIVARVAIRPSGGPEAMVELSSGAAQLLQLPKEGSAPLRVRRMTPAVQERTALRLGKPAAARLDTPESLLVVLRRQAAKLPPPAPPANSPQKIATPSPGLTPLPKREEAPVQAPSVVPKPATQSTLEGGWYVQIAALSRADRAAELARLFDAKIVQFGSVYRVRLGPYPTLPAARAALGPLQSKGYPDARLTR